MQSNQLKIYDYEFETIKQANEKWKDYSYSPFNLRSTKYLFNKTQVKVGDRSDLSYYFLTPTVPKKNCFVPEYVKADVPNEAVNMCVHSIMEKRQVQGLRQNYSAQQPPHASQPHKSQPVQRVAGNRSGPFVNFFINKEAQQKVVQNYRQFKYKRQLSRDKQLVLAGTEPQIDGAEGGLEESDSDDDASNFAKFSMKQQLSTLNQKIAELDKALEAGKQRIRRRNKMGSSFLRDANTQDIVLQAIERRKNLQQSQKSGKAPVSRQKSTIDASDCKTPVSSQPSSTQSSFKRRFVSTYKQDQKRIQQVSPRYLQGQNAKRPQRNPLRRSRSLEPSQKLNHNNEETFNWYMINWFFKKYGYIKTNMDNVQDKKQNIQEFQQNIQSLKQELNSQFCIDYSYEGKMEKAPA